MPKINSKVARRLPSTTVWVVVVVLKRLWFLSELWIVKTKQTWPDSSAAFSVDVGKVFSVNPCNVVPG